MKKDKVDVVKQKLEKLKNKKKDVKKEPKVEKKQKRDKAVPVATESVSEIKPRKGKIKEKLAAEAKALLTSFIDYDEVMDQIEKKYDTGSSQLSDDPRAKLSTGMLVLDLVLSGGILGGGWYTFFGQEQSAKSTLAMQCIIAAIHTDVPLVGYYDYEGCTTIDTLISVGGKQVSLRDLIPLELQENLPQVIGFIEKYFQNIDTLGGEVPAKLYYGGIKECLKVTTESGNTLEGSKHPFMVQLPDGNLAWKMIEELSVGDTVLQQG